MSRRNERNASALQSSREVRRAGLVAGFVVLVLIVGLFVTSLVQAPNPMWSIVLAVLAVGIAIGLVSSLARRRRRGSA
jgi:4-amino-4-deoxy-L-arabinose transferase-like glycosyltransferase